MGHGHCPLHNILSRLANIKQIQLQIMIWTEVSTPGVANRDQSDLGITLHMLRLQGQAASTDFDFWGFRVRLG